MRDFHQFERIDQLVAPNLALRTVARSKHPVEPTDDGHEKAEDEQESPKAIGPAIFGKKLNPGKRLSIGHGALRGWRGESSAPVNLLY